MGDLRNDLRWNADSATLVKTGGDLAAGDRFSIISASPRFSSITLSSATSLDPGDPIYLELPSNFPNSVAVTAREVTAGSTSAYAAALSLQNWMRSEFTYSLEIQEGHGNNAIESFLINRVGYCEQFAGAYAAMLRSLNIAARVAVGFTPGCHRWDRRVFGTGPQRSRLARGCGSTTSGGSLSNRQPGRGAPGAEEYTGVAPQQDEGPAVDDNAADADTPTATVAVPETTLVDSGGAPAPTTVPPPDIEPTSESIATMSSGDSSRISWRVLAVIAAIGLVLAVPAASRRLYRSSIKSPSAQLAHLWTRANRALRSMGLDDSPDRTPSETAAATALVFPVASRPMHSLADVVTYVNYSPDGSEHLDDEGSYGITTLDNCRIWVRQVERAVTSSLTPAARAQR